MRLSSVVALALLVAAFACTLLALSGGAAPFVIDLDQRLARFPGPMASVPDPMLDWILAQSPWLLAVSYFGCMMIPALTLATLGFLLLLHDRRRSAQEVARTMGRRAREKLFQDWIGELIAAHLAPDRPVRATVYRGLVETLPGLEPVEAARFRRLLEASRLHGPEASVPAAARQRPALVPGCWWQGAVFLLVLVGGFMVLWLGLTAAVALTAKPLAHLGMEISRREISFQLVSCSFFTLVPFSAAAGLVWLARRARRLEARGQEVEGQAREDILTRTLDHLRQLVGGGLGGGEGDGRPDLALLARALTLTALPELDAAGRRSLLLVLYDLGLARGPGALDLAAADLRGLDLSGGALPGLRLPGARLAGTSFRGADLAGADLEACDLAGCDLRRAGLGGARLRAARLKSAWLHQACLAGADLSAADLTDANLWQADLRDARLEGAQLEGARLLTDPAPTPPGGGAG